MRQTNSPRRPGMAASYPRGLGPSERRYAISMQLRLLERALAPWPRRHAPLLAVNCGNGAMLHYFWQCGFDVHATEEDAGLRLKAQQLPIPGLEVFAASDDDLPFENDSFDWVVVNVKSGAKKGIEACCSEAARLARRGFMITFWNTQSLAAICWRVSHDRPWAANAASCWLVWRQMRNLGIGRVSIFSTLALPPLAWKWLPQTAWPGRHPLGAWCAARLDMEPMEPATPLPLRLGVNFARPEPLLESVKPRVSDNARSIKKGANKIV